MTATYPRDLIGYGRNPPDPRWPGACARRRAVRRQLRGRRRTLDPAWRRGIGSVPVGRARRRAVAGTAAYERRVDVRVRLARRLLAAVATVRRAQAAGHRVRCRARACAPSRSGRGDARGGLGNREPRPQMDRLQGHAGSGRARRSHRSDPHSHRGRPARVRSAGIPAAPRSTRSSSCWRKAALRTRRIPTPTICPIG